MGNAALPIWDAIPATKSCEGTGGGRIFDWASRPKDNQILWRSPWWGCWSLLDPDDFWRTGMVTLLWRRIENNPSRKYHSRSGGSTYLPIELCNPSHILINWAMFQHYRGIQCSLEVVTQSSSLTRFVGSTKSDLKTWYTIITQLFTWLTGLETFISTMCLASKMCMQMHWHLSLPPSLFQPEQ